MFGRNYQAELKFWPLACGFAAAVCLSACRKEADPPQAGMPAALETRFYAPPGWTWGEVAAGDGPALRYGVTAPASAPRAQVLILPDRGEPAEAWFETAGALIDRGYTVWTLDWSGLGQPEFKGRRGQLTAEDAAAALRVLTGEVIRPEQPLVLLAAGSSSAAARIALARRLPGVEAAILSSPHTDERALAPGTDPKRQRIIGIWTRADPTLKPDGEVDLRGRLTRRQLVEPPALTSIATPITVLDGDSPFQLALDGPRDNWLSLVADVVEKRTEGRALAAAPPPSP